MPERGTMFFLHISLLKPWAGIMKYGSTEDEGGVEWTVIS